MYEPLVKSMEAFDYFFRAREPVHCPLPPVKQGRLSVAAQGPRQVEPKDWNGQAWSSKGYVLHVARRSVCQSIIKSTTRSALPPNISVLPGNDTFAKSPLLPHAINVQLDLQEVNSKVLNIPVRKHDFVPTTGLES